jgi:hypothetical protein
MKVVYENPWFREYRRRNWYYAFYMNYCIYRVFKDNYRNNCVGIDAFLDSMHSIMLSFFRPISSHDAIYMAAKEIFLDEKSLEVFISKNVLHILQKRLFIDSTKSYHVIGEMAKIFSWLIKRDYKDVYDRCVEEIKAQNLKAADDKLRYKITVAADGNK